MDRDKVCTLAKRTIWRLRSGKLLDLDYVAEMNLSSDEIFEWMSEILPSLIEAGLEIHTGKSGVVKK